MHIGLLGFYDSMGAIQQRCNLIIAKLQALSSLIRVIALHKRTCADAQKRVVLHKVGVVWNA